MDIYFRFQKGVMRFDIEISIRYFSRSWHIWHFLWKMYAYILHYVQCLCI